MKTVLTMYITLMPVILTGILNMIFVKINILKCLNIPLDNNKVLKDGKRLFGNNKTIKGFIGYIFIGCIMTIIWGLICKEFKLDDYFYINHNNTIIFNSLLGLLLGFTYSICELPNSFIKRRFDIKEGRSSNKYKILFFLYDQFDSIIGCCLVVAVFYNMSLPFYLFYVFLGGITHVIVNIILYLLKIRKNMF